VVKDERANKEIGNNSYLGQGMREKFLAPFFFEEEQFLIWPLLLAASGALPQRPSAGR
jgi:hypothetical protein